MFRMELYKIAARRITVICSILAMVFTLFWFLLSVPGSEAYVGMGKYYVNSKAIEKNREITIPYEGQLTMEKVEDIWEQYGPPLDWNRTDLEVDLATETANEEYSKNFLNEFVARHFYSSNVVDGEIRYTPLSGEDTAEYLKEGLYFTYTGGWDWYWDGYLLLFLLVSVVVVVALSPVFSEEYSLRTADVSLTTQNGRNKLFWSKLGASLCYTWIFYWGCAFLQLGAYLAALEPKALKAATLYTDLPNWYDTLPLWVSLLTMLLCGWAAVTALACMTLAVSARCRQPFQAVLWSLIFYLGPVMINLVFLRPLRRTLLVRLLLFITASLPFMYTAHFQEGILILRLMLSGVLLVFTLISLWGGKRGYCRHQIS